MNLSEEDPMKTLVVYAHPNPRSFCHAILEAVTEELTGAGIPHSVRDLYALGFDPVLRGEDFVAMQAGTCREDVLREQKFVKEADLIIVIHPVWWFGMPAILKGWIDRVLSYGFAYGMDNNELKGLLGGRRVALFTTTGGDESAYVQFGFGEAITVTEDRGVYGFCGMEVPLHRYLYGLPSSTADQRATMLERVRADIRELLG